MNRKILDAQVLALDIETGTLQPEEGVSKFWRDEIVCISVSTRNENFVYPNLTKAEFWAYFEGKTVILHNATFDLKFLRYIYGGDLPYMKIHDSMLMQGVLDNRLRSYNLKDLCKHHLNVVHGEDVKIKGYLKCMQYAPYSLMFPYAMRDTRVTFDLGVHLMRALQKDPELLEIYQMELDVLPVVIDIEYRGHKIDVPLLNRYTQEYTDRVEALREEIRGCMPTITIGKSVCMYVVIENPTQYYRILKDARYDGFSREQLEKRKVFTDVSYPFNPQSSAHIVQYMLGKGYDWDEVTSKGGRSTKGTILQRLANLHDDKLLLLMMELRQTTKVLTTYFVNIKYNLDEEGYVHCSYKQVASATGGAETGRFSCSNPNLQNLPTHNAVDLYMNVKHLFIPDSPKDTLMFLDYDSQEMRLMAGFSGDPMLLEFVEGDMHQYVADKLNIPRDTAKTVNYAMLYGAGPNKIVSILELVKHYYTGGVSVARATKLAKKEARRIYNGFWEVISVAKDYKQHREDLAVAKGYTTTKFGRKRYIEADKAFTALNARIQGTAGDIMKIALVRIANGLYNGKLRSRIINTVHDEVVMNVASGEEAIVSSLVIKAMEDFKFDPPLKVDVEQSSVSWGDKYLQKRLKIGK